MKRSYRNADSSSGLWVEEDGGAFYLCRYEGDKVVNTKMNKCYSFQDATKQLTELELQGGYFSEQTIQDANLDNHLWEASHRALIDSMNRNLPIDVDDLE